MSRARAHRQDIRSSSLTPVLRLFLRRSSGRLSAGSRDTAGSGLGLAIVRQVAQAHGGEALVANPNGGGAEFRLRLD
ncbi:MAG: ATP-binding protein [Solirubrobacterales bacterium]